MTRGSQPRSTTGTLAGRPQGVRLGPGRIRGRLGGLRGRPDAERADRRPRRPGPGRVGAVALLARPHRAPVPRPAGAGPRAGRLGRDGLGGGRARPRARRRARRRGGLALDLPGQRAGLRADHGHVAALRRRVTEEPERPGRCPRPAAGGSHAGRAHRWLHHRRPAGLARPAARRAARGRPARRLSLRQGRTQAPQPGPPARPVPVQEPQRRHRRRADLQPGAVRIAALPVSLPAGGRGPAGTTA